MWLGIRGWKECEFAQVCFVIWDPVALVHNIHSKLSKRGELQEHSSVIVSMYVVCQKAHNLSLSLWCWHLHWGSL